jgi:hypothetical protein
MMAAMDEPDPPGDEAEDDAPAPPPSAFGLPAHPAGCGLLGGLLLALAIAPVVLVAVAPNTCSEYGRNCRWPPQGTGLGLALTGWAGAAFGLATAALVGRRLALWREGRRVRPALWVSFVALFVLAWGPGSVLLSLLLFLVETVG